MKGIKDSVLKYIDEYSEHLFAYMRTYTKGALHARVMKAKAQGIMELYREIIYKGKDFTKTRIRNLRLSVLNPKAASKDSDLDQALSSWEHDLMLLKENGAPGLNDDDKKAILLTIIPGNYVKLMREKFDDPKNEDYYDFLHCLLYTSDAADE